MKTGLARRAASVTLAIYNNLRTNMANFSAALSLAIDTLTGTIRRPVGVLLLVLFLPAACASSDVESPALDATAVSAPAPDTLSGIYLSARHAQAEQDMANATRFFTTALGIDPEAPGLLRRTFVILIAEGRMAEASQMAGQVLEKDPNSPIAGLMMVVDDLKNNRLQQAREKISSLPEGGLNTIMAPLFGAWTAIGLGETPQQALEILAPLNKKGSQPLYNLHAGLINDLAGDRAAAESAFLKNVGLNGGPSLRLVQLLGNLYERQADKAKAETLYGDHGAHNPQSPIAAPALARLAGGQIPPPMIATIDDGVAEALFGVASSLIQQNAGETALIFGRMALYLKPDFPVMQILLGSILERNNRLADANRVYHDINPASPYAATARLRYSDNLDALDQTDDAIKLLGDIAGENPALADPLIRLGDLLRRHERFDEAVEAYDSAANRIGELTAAHWSLLYSRGIVLERSGQWDRAEADLLKALEYEPEQPYVLNYLGYSWVDQGINLDRGKEMIRKAVNLRPRDGYIIDSLGWAHYRLGEYGESVKEMERAVGLRPEDPVINDHLGDAYWRVGRKNEARFQWQRVLTLGTDDEAVRSRAEDKLKNGLPEAE